MPCTISRDDVLWRSGAPFARNENDKKKLHLYITGCNAHLKFHWPTRRAYFLLRIRVLFYVMANAIMSRYRNNNICPSGCGVRAYICGRYLPVPRAYYNNIALLLFSRAACVYLIIPYAYTYIIIIIIVDRCLAACLLTIGRFSPHHTRLLSSR